MKRRYITEEGRLTVCNYIDEAILVREEIQTLANLRIKLHSSLSRNVSSQKSLMVRIAF